MIIEKFQDKCVKAVNEVDKKLGITHNNETTMIHLTEELGEIARQITNPKLKRSEIDKENLSEELADVVLLISKLADNNQINLEESIEKKIKELKERHSL